ncbi:unnamed protein product, partial [Polarella glacialis]
QPARCDDCDVKLPGAVPELLEKVWPMAERKPSVAFGRVEVRQTDEEAAAGKWDADKDEEGYVACNRAGVHEALQCTNTLAGTRVGMLNIPHTFGVEEEDA